MTEGQYLYTVEHTLLGEKLQIRRVVLLKWDEKADRFEIGDSKDPRSCCLTSFVSRGLGEYYESPIEAVNAYITLTTKQCLLEIKEAKDKIKQQEEIIRNIRRLDWTKLKIQSYADDWTPCDF